MQKQFSITKEISDRLDIEAKRLGLTRSGYVKMALVKSWSDRDGKEEKKN